MPGNSLVQSLARGLDLIRLLAESDSGLSMPDLIEATGLKRPTIHNLLRTLVSRDFVRKEGNRFRVGLAIHEMVAQDASNQLLELAEVSTCTLAERLPDATVSYSEPLGGDVVVRFRKFPERVLMERNSGALMLPYQTASGLAYVAHADPETRRAIQLQHPFEVSARSFWDSELALETFLKRVRERGFVELVSGGDGSFMRLAFPSITATGRFVGVFGASFQAEGGDRRVDVEKAMTVLRDAASELVAHVG